MITVEAALSLISENLPQWEPSRTTLDDLAPQISLAPLIADREYPPFHRVMMDGIAVSYEAYSAGARKFRIAGTCAAGSPAGRLENFSDCLEVMTGAPLPSGSDLVIQVEHLEVEGGFAEVTVEIPRERMESVHEKGSDCRAGDVLLAAGKEMNGPRWGIAASLGYASVKTARLPRVLVVSTGDELVEVSEAPQSHQIRRSNAHALRASLLMAGYRDVGMAHLRDDEKEIADHYRSASREFEVLIYSGGVSKGKFDYLPGMWRAAGVREIFHGVAQRPGKPLWFGVDEATKTTVFGLPGNPVSSLVCLHRYFIANRDVYARLEEEISFGKDLTYFAPVKSKFLRDGTFVVTPVPLQNSGEFAALAESDGFIELPREPSVFRRGEAFRYFAWNPRC